MTEKKLRIIHKAQMYDITIAPNSPAYKEFLTPNVKNLATLIDAWTHATSISAETDRRLQSYRQFYSPKKIREISQETAEHAKDSMLKIVQYINQGERTALGQLAVFWLATQRRQYEELGLFDHLDTQRLAQLGIKLTPKY